MHTVIMAGHPWDFHSTSGKITDRLQDITDTGSRIEVIIMAIGAPMTADTSIQAIATMEMCMALNITVTGESLIVATVVGDTKCANAQHAPKGLGWTIRGIHRMNAPDNPLKKA